MVNFSISSNIHPIKLKLSQMTSEGLKSYFRSKFYKANRYFSKYETIKNLKNRNCKNAKNGRKINQFDLILRKFVQN